MHSLCKIFQPFVAQAVVGIVYHYHNCDEENHRQNYRFSVHFLTYCRHNACQRKEDGYENHTDHKGDYADENRLDSADK